MRMLPCQLLSKYVGTRRACAGAEPARHVSRRGCGCTLTPRCVRYDSLPPAAILGFGGRADAGFIAVYGDVWRVGQSPARRTVVQLQHREPAGDAAQRRGHSRGCAHRHRLLRVVASSAERTYATTKGGTIGCVVCVYMAAAWAPAAASAPAHRMSARAVWGLTRLHQCSRLVADGKSSNTIAILDALGIVLHHLSGRASRGGLPMRWVGVSHHRVSMYTRVAATVLQGLLLMSRLQSTCTKYVGSQRLCHGGSGRGALSTCGSAH